MRKNPQPRRFYRIDEIRGTDDGYEYRLEYNPDIYERTEMTATGRQTFPRTDMLMTQDNIPIPTEMVRSILPKAMESAEENFQ